MSSAASRSRARRCSASNRKSGSTTRSSISSSSYSRRAPPPHPARPRPNGSLSTALSRHDILPRRPAATRATSCQSPTSFRRTSTHASSLVATTTRVCAIGRVRSTSSPRTCSSARSTAMATTGPWRWSTLPASASSTSTLSGCAGTTLPAAHAAPRRSKSTAPPRFPPHFLGPHRVSPLCPGAFGVRAAQLASLPRGRAPPQA